MKFKKTNGYIYLALIIHIYIAFSLEENILAFFPLGGNLVGLYFLSFTNKQKLGAKIFMISSFFFVHLGVIGVVGCLEVLGKLTNQDFLKTNKIKSLTNKNKVLALIAINIILILISSILPIDDELNIIIIMPILVNINFFTCVHGVKQNNTRLAILSLILMFASSIISILMYMDFNVVGW